MKSKDFGAAFWLHILLAGIYVLAPWWADWRITVVVAGLQELQYILCGGCVLTRIELGQENKSFWHYYLSKSWPDLNKKKVRWLVRIGLPLLVVGTSLFVQEILGYQPWWSLK